MKNKIIIIILLYVCPLNAQNSVSVDTLEHTKEIRQEKIDKEKTIILDSINHVYIPKNLQDCFIELDKLLDSSTKKEMKKLKNREDMITYHLSIGMWIRNNWGLRKDSRIEKYFFEKRTFSSPDDISSLILNYYHDWLNGKKETWKEWEKNPTRR